MALLNKKYLFVHINKSGGGVITNNMAKNGHISINNYHRSLEKMLKLTKRAYNLDANDLYIFTMVRNPYERLLSLYLFYNKNNYNSNEYYNSNEFFSGDPVIDDNFNNWVEYIYSDKFDKTRVHSDVNIYKYCFCSQLNWLKDSNGNMMKVDKILRHENSKNEYEELFKDIMKLENYDFETKVHPTKHAHYSEYYNEKSIELVTKHCQDDLDCFGYIFEDKRNTNKSFKIQSLKNEVKSYSQCGQEQFVLKHFKNKENGTFIELGGLDGIRHSNTYQLENKYNWHGLIIEPSPSLYEELKQNRNVYTENKLVGDTKKDNIDFLYIEDKTKCIGLQGIPDHYNDNHIKRINRELGDYKSKIIQLEMDTLQSLCDKYNLVNIDYLSLDVEGSELIVLQGIDFSKLNIKMIGVEINYEENKKNIFDLLIKNNYKFEKVVGDYFFIKND